MEKSLNDYDKNLEELERQREKLEMVMKMMGQEWEERGPGIGWLGSLDLLPEIDQTNEDLTSPTTIEAIPAPITTSTEIVPESTVSSKSISIQPLLNNILSPQTGPSPEYLQSLLHVNEVLLAQSLANTGNTTINDPIDDNDINNTNLTPMLTPIMDPLNGAMTDISNSPLITPNDDDTSPDDNNNNTQTSYMGNKDPESEKIISPLLAEDKQFNTTFTLPKSNLQF